MNDFLNGLENLIQSVVGMGEPTLTLAVNVIVLALIVGYVIWRVKSELRGIQWDKLTFSQRREIIQSILSEAINLAEWLGSNLPAMDDVQKKKVAEQKRKLALKYTKAELRAMGAARQDLHTLGLRLEQVFADLHPDKIRFGASVRPTVKVD